MESYLIIIFISLLIIFKQFHKSDVIYTEFFDDNKKKKNYLVRNLTDKNKAVAMLYKIEKTLKLLVDKLLNDTSVLNSNMIKYVNNIKNKINGVEIQETPGDSIYTSYSVNKGEILVFCLRSKHTNEIHNLNDLLYVAIHELAHIGCPEVGHTDLFYKINQYLIHKAIEYGIYKYVDYSNDNREYCGMKLTVTVANN